MRAPRKWFLPVIICLLGLTRFAYADNEFDRESPRHLFVLFSYGHSFAPDRTHTFGFFAKMNPNDLSKVLEHVPISWLPVVTKPIQNANGIPDLDKNDTVQIASVATLKNRARLGWNFSMKKSIQLRRTMPAFKDIRIHGAFAITEQQYDAAKNFREQMLENVSKVLDGQPRNMERYYYRPANQTLFYCPNGKTAGVINCFQAVMASFGVCETSGPLSGVTITDYLLARLRTRRVLGEAYLKTSEEIIPLLDQVLEAEFNGDFDRPGQ